MPRQRGRGRADRDRMPAPAPGVGGAPCRARRSGSAMTAPNVEGGWSPVATARRVIVRKDAARETRTGLGPTSLARDLACAARAFRSMPASVAWTSGTARLDLDDQQRAREPGGAPGCRSTARPPKMLNVASGATTSQPCRREPRDPLDDLGVIGVQQTSMSSPWASRSTRTRGAEPAAHAHEHPVRDPVRAAALDAADRGLREARAAGELHLGPAAPAAERTESQGPNRTGSIGRTRTARHVSEEFGTMAYPPFAMLVECGHMRRATPRHG